MKSITKKFTYIATAAGLALIPNAAMAMSQDETAYIKLNTDGSVQNISVTEHLTNDQHEAQLFDRTILTKVENLNGFENFKLDGTNLQWEASGKDIYYRGTTDKELPVKLQISYRLNGEEKSIEEMLGKSGRAEVRMKFTNLSKVGNMYTPFVAAVTTTLDTAANSQVEVTNGKAMSNGRTTAIAAVAAPGLYESLELEELKDTGEVVLSFDTERFELNDIYVAVTPKLLDSADLKTFSELDKLYSSANQLATSSKQLVEGTKNLQAGISKLQNGVVAARQKIAATQISPNEKELEQVKAIARAKAEQSVEAQRATITANVKQQIEGNAVMMSAFKLQAEQMCQAQLPAGMTCPDAKVQEITKTIVAEVEKNMIESSMALAKTTASQTAAATAETTAKQVAATVQKSVVPAMTKAFDTIISGIDQVATGSAELQNGMTKFDQDGIQTLNNFVNGKVKVTSNKVKQLLAMAEAYNNYAGIADDTEGTVKFIMMVDGKH